MTQTTSILRPSLQQQETLAEVLAALSTEHEQGIRFIDMDHQETYYSYAEFCQQVYRMADNLAAQGVVKNQQVALLLPDHKHFMLAFLAVAVLGAIAVPMPTRAGISHNLNSYLQSLNHLVAVSMARHILCTDKTYVLLDEGGDNVKINANARLLSVENLHIQAAPKHSYPVLNGQDTCFLQFTSGSTSMPKGVMVSHQNIINNAQGFLGIESGIDRRDDDVLLGWLPLFHDMGLMTTALAPLVVNLPAVLLPTETFGRRPWEWLKALHKYKATITYAPNFAYELVTTLTRMYNIKGVSLSHLRIAGCGAEPINPDVLNGFAEKFSDIGFKKDALTPCFGMAEATLAVSVHPYGTPLIIDTIDTQQLKEGLAVPINNTKDIAEPPVESDAEQVERICMVSCGPALVGHQLKIVDPQNQSLGDRIVGEVCFRGPSVTQGYFRDLRETTKNYRDGWLHTGDLGYMVDGNLYICGRIKDLIIINGVNYYPQDIEWAISSTFKVRPNKVVAFSSLKSGREAIIICVELSKKRSSDKIKTDIMRAVESLIGLPVNDVLALKAGSLLLTSSGKVKRQKMKQLYEEHQLEEHDTTNHNIPDLPDAPHAPHAPHAIQDRSKAL